MQNKLSSRYSLTPIAEAIRQARLRKGWSQRELGARSRIPQAQISRFENGDVDPRVSTLVELARTLDLDLLLAPRSALTAARAAIRSAEDQTEGRAVREIIATVELAAEEACKAAPEREDIAMIQENLRDLARMTPQIPPSFLTGELQTLLINLQRFAADTPAWRARRARTIIDAVNRLKHLRSELACSPAAERPAYSLDDKEWL